MLLSNVDFFPVAAPSAVGSLNPAIPLKDPLGPGITLRLVEDESASQSNSAYFFPLKLKAAYSRIGSTVAPD